jgi:TRAP transporter TAXI family solute receptor
MGRLLGVATFAIMMACAVAAKAEDTDIASVKARQSLQALFQPGSALAKQALNANSVTLMSGTIGGTYVQFAADIASVLDDGNQMRILPVVGRGSVQNVADILYLQGVDLGIVRADTFDYLEKRGLARNLRNQFTYITKLYNEEMHVIAPRSVRSLQELEGKIVSIDLPNGGTFVTAQVVLEQLGVRPKFVYLEQRIALEKLKAGELDAVISVQGKPSPIISQINDDRLHLVPVDYARSLQGGDYLPASLSAKDYPNLIAEQEQVDTIAVPSVLAAYNWGPLTGRYRKLSLFVDNFFSKFPGLQNPPFHPKWSEVSLSAPLPGWRRFAPAKQWLDSHGIVPVARVNFDEMQSQNSVLPRRQTMETDQDGLLKQFKNWDDQNARAAGRRPMPLPRRELTTTVIR